MRRVSSRNIYFLLLCLCLLIFCGCTKSTGEDTETDTTEVSATTEALETVALKDAEIGDIVQMGTYEQDGDPETEDPICWDVLDKDGDAVLLISHDVIAYQRFSDSRKCVDMGGFRDTDMAESGVLCRSVCRGRTGKYPRDNIGESIYSGICCACGPIRGCTGTGEQTGYKG